MHSRNSLPNILRARGYMLRTIYKYRKRRYWSIVGMRQGRTLFYMYIRKGKDDSFFSIAIQKNISKTVRTVLDSCASRLGKLYRIKKKIRISKEQTETHRKREKKKLSLTPFLYGASSIASTSKSSAIARVGELSEIPRISTR